MTQRELARGVNRKQPYISMIECGVIDDVDTTLLLALAHAVGVAPMELVIDPYELLLKAKRQFSDSRSESLIDRCELRARGQRLGFEVFLG